ncbi:MAG TPA: 50S ribosomal protein L23 [Chthoniobacteraceae bacterium]|nr:50S ribosomal protein L23 [Chthoniobacteraceae bacterium]
MTEHHDIVETIHLTEKSTVLGEKHNQYVFRVNPDANKLQIKEAIEKLFGKKVVSVNTANYRGKTKTRGQRVGRTAHWKKAIVTLKEGEKIDLT